MTAFYLILLITQPAPYSWASRLFHSLGYPVSHWFIPIEIRINEQYFPWLRDHLLVAILWEFFYTIILPFAFNFIATYLLLLLCSYFSKKAKWFISDSIVP